MAATIGGWIRVFAFSQPGGVIRWAEAAHIYLTHSPAARMQQAKGWTHFHQNVAKILRKDFTKVEGTRGFYVLNEMMKGEP